MTFSILLAFLGVASFNIVASRIVLSKVFAFVAAAISIALLTLFKLTALGKW